MLSLCLLLPARKLYFYRAHVNRSDLPRWFPLLQVKCAMWTSLIVRVEPIIFMVQEFCRACTPGRKGDLGGHRNMLLNSETCSHTALHDHFPPDSEETQSPCHDLPGYLCEIIFLNSSTMSVTIHHRPKSYYIFDAVFLSCPLQFVPFLFPQRSLVRLHFRVFVLLDPSAWRALPRMTAWLMLSFLRLYSKTTYLGWAFPTNLVTISIPSNDHCIAPHLCFVFCP